MWLQTIKKFFIFIHPHFSNSVQVFCDSFEDAIWELIRAVFLSEDVTNTRARNDLNATTTHPKLTVKIKKTFYNV